MNSLRSSFRSFASFLLLVTMASGAVAATRTVTTTADAGAGSLRQAVVAAAPGDTIVFALPVPSTIRLTGGQIMLTKDVTIAGPGPDRLTVQGIPNSRVFRVSATATAQISGLTITGGSYTAFPGGGIYCDSSTLYLSNCVLTKNQGSSGGALALRLATVFAADCTFSENVGLSSGGAVRCDEGTLFLTRSALFQNRAPFGGAIAVISGSVDASNSTLVENSADFGGAAFLNNGNLSALQTTVTRNKATTAGGGLRVAAGGGIELANSIVAGNTAPTQPDLSLDALSGQTLRGGCVIGNATGTALFLSGQNLVGTAAAPIDAKLGPLRDHGGPTWSVALLPGSPAYNAGDAALVIDILTQLPLGVDQRGLGRVAGNRVDAGAFEAMAPRYYTSEALRLLPLRTTGDATTDANFQTARSFLQPVQDLAYWVDDFSLRRNGGAVFAAEAQAATALAKIVAANGPFARTARLSLDALAEADRRIASDAIALAAATPGVNAAQLAQARTSLGQAESFRALRKMAEAISTYGVAWRTALQARGIPAP